MKWYPYGKRSLMAMMALFALFIGRGKLEAGHECGGCCPHCQTCCPTPEVIKVKKHKWEVECKPICVPAIKWPWQKCCEPPRCGFVKNVKVLKKFEYECEKCGYKWEVRDCCGAGDCTTGSCTGEEGAAMAAPEAPSEAAPPVPPKPMTRLIPASPEHQPISWQPANLPTAK